MRAINLKTERLKDPVGIDAVCPVLSWNCEDGLRQSAYRIVACNEGGKVLWDSGKTESRSMRCAWSGKPVAPKTRINWNVTLWDENDVGGEAAEAFFETGIDKWSAGWIKGDYTVKRGQRYPVDCFRKGFEANGIKKARLYISACGLYEARLNGERTGGFVMAPGYTDYRKRVQYQTYDITSLIKEGHNELTVMLADGWYRGSCGAWGLTDQFGRETKLIAQLELELSDGGRKIIATDDTWDWSSDGPLRFADMKDGEKLDASATASYSGKAKPASHKVIPTCSNNVPVTEHERLKPVIITTPEGKTVLDFNQNIQGYVEFELKAEKGQRIFLRFGELLDEKGEFTQKNIQCSSKLKTTPLQQVEYICADGENHYKTTFAVFGFRYILVETDVLYKAEDFTAVAVYSDMLQTGSFNSSNELLNRFVNATLWSAKGNSLEIPTDCPTRERHGWTGDAQIFFNTAAYLMDYGPFAAKYVQDIYDWQRPDGKLPQIAPYGGVDSYMSWMDGSVGWADAGVLIPYRFWKIYGDDGLIKKHYDGMVRYAGFMISRCRRFTPLKHYIHIKGGKQRYLVNFGQSYGEWAEPADVCPNKWTNVVLPHPEESTAYTSYIMGLMVEIARYMNRPEDEKLFKKYRDGCAEAYRELLSLPEYSLDTDRQAKLVRPLYMGLLNEEQKAFAERRLVQAMDNYGWRLGTGFLSTPFILDVLASLNIEYAYRLLENEEMPGWLFMTKNGATTIWESWEGTKAQNGIASLNHYSKGAMCEWLFRAMCGINVAGENHFVISPKPGGSFSFAGAGYDSVYGRIESGWEKTADGMVYTVTVPANCTAEIILPNGYSETVGSGTYTYGR